MKKTLALFIAGISVVLISGCSSVDIQEKADEYVAYTEKSEAIVAKPDISSENTEIAKTLLTEEQVTAFNEIIIAWKLDPQKNTSQSLNENISKSQDKTPEFIEPIIKNLRYNTFTIINDASTYFIDDKQAVIHVVSENTDILNTTSFLFRKENEIWVVEDIFYEEDNTKLSLSETIGLVLSLESLSSS